MVQKVKMHALGTDSQYTKIHPETSVDQVLIREGSEQTLAQTLGDTTKLQTTSKEIVGAINEAKKAGSDAAKGLGDVTKLETVQKDVVGAINEVKQYGNSVKQSMVSSLLSVDSSLPITQDSTWEQINSNVRNIQSGMDIHGIIEQYKVAANGNISAGDFVDFIEKISFGPTTNENNGEKKIQPILSTRGDTFRSVCKIDDQRILVVYSDVNNSSYGTAVVLTVSGTSVSVGTPFLFAEESISNVTSTYVEGNNVLVSYTAANIGKTVVLTASGSTLTKGQIYTFINVSSSYLTSTLISTGKVLVCYSDNSASSAGTAVVLSVTGTSVSVGATKVLTNNSVTYIDLTYLSSGKAIVCYRDGTNSNYGAAQVLTVSGTTITAGAATIFSGNNAINYLSCAALATGSVIVAYNNTGISKICSIVLNISGTTITFGTQKEITDQVGAYVYVAKRSNGTIYLQYVILSRTFSRVLSVSGTTITVANDEKLVSVRGGSAYGLIEMPSATLRFLSDGKGPAYIINNIGVDIHGQNNYLIDVDPDHMSAAALDSNRVLVTYFSSTGSTTHAVIVQAVGDVITVGQPVLLYSGSGSYTSTVKLNDNSALISYLTGANGFVVKVNTSGLVITLGTPVIYNSVNTSYAAMIYLETNKFMIAHRGDVNYAYVTIITVNGETISVASQTAINSAATTYMSLDVMSGKNILLSYKTVNKYVVPLTVSYYTVTVGTPVQYASTGSYTMSSMMHLRDNLFALAENGNTALLSSLDNNLYLFKLEGGKAYLLDSLSLSPHTTVIMGVLSKLKGEKYFVTYRDYDYMTKVRMFDVDINNKFVLLDLNEIDGAQSSNGFILTSVEVADGLLMIYESYKLRARYSFKGIVDGDNGIFVTKSTDRNSIKGISKTSGVGGNTVEVYTL